MSNMEVGEYIRTIDGYIRKIDNVNTDKQKITYYGKYILDMPYKNSQAVAEKKIKAHSFNIIDLIEEGDYVNGNIVYEVLDDEIELLSGKIRKKRIHFITGHLIDENEIKTILTHEQYEQNSYKIGE